MIDNERLIALDIETSNGRGSGSLEPRDEGSVIALVQLGYEDGTIEIHDWNEDTEAKIARLIDEDYRFVIHNASFELDWFGLKSNLRFPKLWCTMVASQVLNAGKRGVDEATALSGRLEEKDTSHVGLYDLMFEEQDENIEVNKKSSSKFSNSYQAVVYRYAGVKVTKDQGNSDWLRRPLSPEQIRYAKDDVRYLIKVARNQWNFVKKLKLQNVIELEMRLLNVLADMKITGTKIDIEPWRESAQVYAAKAQELEEELNYKLGLELAEREGELSLFGTYVPKAFKVSSPTQLARFFDLEKADESTLRAIEHPLMPKILEYREADKIAGTYGDGYLKYIWPQDSRIHSNLIQAETATGRLSSRRPNLQNVPPDMIKSFITTDEGKVLMMADYSAVESRILAYVARDANFIEIVNAKDIHSENARRIFNIPPDSPVDPELRRRAKVLSFSIPYGVSAVGLYNRGIAETVDEAQELLDDFFRNYPNVHRFLKNAIAQALTRGYTQNPYGRIRWYEIPKNATEEEIRQATGSASRAAQNHGIQSTSADITKKALVDINDYLHETGYGRLLLTIHDSIISELNIETAGEAAYRIKQIMEDAGPAIVPGIVTPVDVDMGHKVDRICVISGLKFSTFTHKLVGDKLEEDRNYIEPRVRDLMEKNNIKNDFSAKENLRTLVLARSDEWKNSNKDLVNALLAT